MTLRERLRDWWRGYSDADVESASRKISAQTTAGSYVEVTDGEWRAMVAGWREQAFS